MSDDAAPQPTFPAVRDLAVMVGRAMLCLEPEVLEQAIAEGERALAAGPVLDPTLYRQAGGELEQELELMRAMLTCRRALEAFRPPAPPAPQTPGDPA